MHWWIKTNLRDYLTGSSIQSVQPHQYTKTCARNTGQNEIPKHKFPISYGIEQTAEMRWGEGQG